MSRRAKCDNCGKAWSIGDVVPLALVKNLGRRLDPGSEVPAGECPACGALVYFIRRPRVVKIEVAGGVAECTRQPKDVIVDIIDYDNE